ncbi:ricin-type beta-trefoil lectin domain protein, partial [Kitasatospora sp. NPDC002227]|uniref:ricin-type beta-trefoil lectin domain protein n=1 Tax=Kitasatospora sp. NPDC002227 TaxID=3154773 RepID=UPI003324BB17
GIAPDDENNKYYRHHIANNPHITTNYDLQPSIWYPRTSPRAGSASNNTSTDCTTDGTTDGTHIAWIGANQNITFTASNWSPAGMNLHTVFRLWNDQGWNWSGDSGWAGNYNPNGVSVNAGSLVDGRRYAWTANAFDADPTSQGLGSPDSQGCAFRVDKTPPTVAITSPDFPPSGTLNPTPGKRAGDAGTFTLTGTDPAPAGGESSGLACYRVTTDPTPTTNWHCTDGPGNGIVLPTNPTYPFTPVSWGTNILYAQAQDNAGNYSQPVSYAFYAPWNPSAKAVFGDVTGDGKPDVLLPDAAGNLKLVGTGADPANATSFSAAKAPSGTWNGLQITHRSTLRNPVFPVDDLIVHKPGDPMMYLYANTGTGANAGTYGQATPFYPSGSATPTQTTCVDTSGKPVVTGTLSGCPTGVGYDFSQVSQVLALGNPDNELTTAPLSKTALVVVINGSLWLMPPGGNTVLLKKTDTQLSSAPWDGSNNTDGYDLIGPGPANGTTSWTVNSVTTTVNQATLWARDRKTGKILAYPITKNSDGTTNYAALADPTAGTVIGSGIDATGYPTVGSSGDLNGDGAPDLWATNAAGQLTIWTGTADANGKVTGLTNNATPTSLSAPADQWTLAGADQSGTKTGDAVGRGSDPLGANPGTVTNVSFGPDTINNSATTVATFAGTGKIDTTATLDTNKSFKIDVWAKPSALGGIVASSDGANSSGFILWPESTDGNWRFALNWSDDNAWNYDQTTDVITSNAHVQLNTWTHLTAVFNADTRQTSLYVNGVLSANGRHPGSSGINGPIAIGRYKYQGAPSAYYSGSISDLSVYTGSAALTSSRPGPVLTGMAGYKCIDDNGAGQTNGSTIQILDCNGTPAQQWTVNANGSLNVMGGCLDNTNGINANGNVVHWYTCNGSPAQVWIPRADGSIYNPNTGRCLDLPSGNTTNGNPLQIWDCTAGSPVQRWIVPTAN